MHEENRAILAIAARVLSYPDQSLVREMSDVDKLLEASVTSEQKQMSMAEAVNVLRKYPLKELQEIYVGTFDWKEKTGLYLTAHEYGDNRKRGAALIQLQKIISEAGFERADGELADYMPMLYELLAVADEEAKHMSKLERRLACATYCVAEAIADDHPYKPVFSVLTDDVFETPTDEEMKKLGEEKEDPDLDTMPYPLMYQ